MTFVDTNVFVYARDVAHPQKQAIAGEWLLRLWREQSGRTSMQVLSELYLTLTRKLRPGLCVDEAWEDIEALMAWDSPSVDCDVIRRAHETEKRYRLSWWDSMIVAAAQLQECDTLLSEDLQDGMRFGQVTVRSPFKLDVGETPAAYHVQPVIAQRHRPRGRPRQQPMGKLATDRQSP